MTTIIERKIVYRVALPNDLADLLEAMISNKDAGTEFSEKAIREFYRKLLSFAGDIAKAAGIFETPQLSSGKKAVYGSKRVIEIRDWVNNGGRFVSASEIAVHFHFSKSRALTYMNQLVQRKEVEVIKGDKHSNTEPRIGPLPKALAVAK